LPLARPTAKQLLVEGHETPFHVVFEAPTGFGVGVIDHAGSAAAGPADTASAPATMPEATATVNASPSRRIGSPSRAPIERVEGKRVRVPTVAPDRRDAVVRLDMPWFFSLTSCSRSEARRKPRTRSEIRGFP